MSRPHSLGRRACPGRLDPSQRAGLPPRLCAQVAAGTLDARVPGPHPRAAAHGLRDPRGRSHPQRQSQEIVGRLKTLQRIYHAHFLNERRERLFLASLGFLLTFAIVRAITPLIRAGVGPFHNVGAGGLHIHHLVWGILLLLVVGYVWLIEEGTNSNWLATPTRAALRGGARRPRGGVA